MRTTDERRGVVLSIEGSTVVMVEDRTAEPFEVTLAAPGGVRPMEGDYWLCRRSVTGYWTLDRIITPRKTDVRPHRTFREAWKHLIGRGLVDTAFMDGDHPEAPHLAYIGEVRWFSAAPDPHFWIPADGATHDRIEYPELAAVVDPAGTAATFTAPAFPAVPAIESPQVPSYQNSWADFSTAGFAVMRYWREGRNLVIAGAAENPAATSAFSTIFQLPDVYRPSAVYIYTAYANNSGVVGANRITVRSNGIVDAQNSSTTGYGYISAEAIRVPLPVANGYYQSAPYVCAR